MRTAWFTVETTVRPEAGLARAASLVRKGDDMTNRIENPALEQLISGACRVVGAMVEVTAITVVPGKRMSYEELARAHAYAASCNVHLTMDGRGDVRLRRRDTPKAALRINSAALDRDISEAHWNG